MGLAKPGNTRRLTGTGTGLARQEAPGWVFGRFWNRTEPFFRSKPGPLAGYPDPLLTLTMKCLRQQRMKFYELGMYLLADITMEKKKHFGLYEFLIADK
jgi:hypothetical protein